MASPVWLADGGGVATALRRVARRGAVGFLPCPRSAKQIPNAGNDAVLKCIAVEHKINNLSITLVCALLIAARLFPESPPHRVLDSFFTQTPHLITQSIVFVTQVMARKQQPPPSSKKMARKGKKKQPKKAQVYSSSSSESEADRAGPTQDDPHSDDSHSDGSLLDHPQAQASDGNRSPPERTSPSALDAHSDCSSSQECTSPPPSGRNSRQSSRSSRRSSAQEVADQSEEDLQFISHQPAENLISSDGLEPTGSEPVAAEKFTTPKPAPGLQAPEAPRAREVNSALLIAKEENKPTSPPQQQQKPSHPHPRNNSPGSSPVPPVNDPSRPATVASRMPPASPAARRMNALEDGDGDKPAGGPHDGDHAGAAQAALQQLPVDAAPKPSSDKPAKVSDKRPRAEGRKSNRAANNAADKPSNGAGDPTPAIMMLLATMQSQMEHQERRLEARERAEAQAANRRPDSDVEDTRDELLREINALKEVVRLKEEKELREARHNPMPREAPPTQHFAALQDPEYLCRFEVLMKAGQRTMAEVAEALDATKRGGVYSSGRADYWLKAKANTRFLRTLQEVNSSLPEDQEPIAEHSKLGSLLQAPGNEDAVDIIVKLRDAHARA